MSTVSLDQGTQASVHLAAAILCYRSDTNKCVATIHRVDVKDGIPTIQPGKPCTMEGVQAFFRALASAKNSAAYLDGRILAHDLNCVVWWKPSCVRQMWFRNTKDEKLDRISGRKFSHPPLVFKADSRGLSVFALRSDRRPTPDTRLYQAPYFNIYEGGRMCTGSVKLPDRPDPANIKAYEDGLFDSRFTHAAVPKLTTHPKGHYGYWTDKKWERWRGLIATKLTLADLLNSKT